MTTPEKQYVITQSQVDAVKYASQFAIEYGINVFRTLESLPELTAEPEAVPVAWILQNSKDSHKKLSWAENVDFENILLYTHPPVPSQPLQPITAEDVTEEMIDAWRTCRYGVRYFNEEIASAVNVWIEHRGVK